LNFKEQKVKKEVLAKKSMRNPKNNINFACPLK